MITQTDFAALLAGSAREHGHLCPGQVVGVRMAVLGLRLLGFSLPPTPQELKRLLVYVEMDRCAADAVAFVAGVKLGRRSLKHRDYGIMAASFLDLASGLAYRVVSREEARDLAEAFAPEGGGRVARQLAAYQRMPEQLLFRVERVVIPVKEVELPGPTRRKVVCQACGQVVRDGREVLKDGRVLCRPCAEGAYFQAAHPVNWVGMEWAPQGGGPSLPPPNGLVKKLG